MSDRSPRRATKGLLRDGCGVLAPRRLDEETAFLSSTAVTNAGGS
jgi:hypothetical protein